MGVYILFLVLSSQLLFLTVECAVDPRCTTTWDVMYPFGKRVGNDIYGCGDYGDSMGCPNDDQPYGPIRIGNSATNGVNIFGTTYNTIYVSVNGALSNQAMYSYSPQGFPIDTSQSITTMCTGSSQWAGASSSYCWMSNYYATEDEWVTAVERVESSGSACVHGTEFVRNAGSGSWSSVSRTTVYAYVAPNCITYVSSGTVWVPSSGNWMIAVFWHDIDVRYGLGKFYFSEISNDNNGVLTLIKTDVERMYRRSGDTESTFNPTKGISVTWTDVTFYGGGSRGYPSGCEAQGYPTGCEADSMYIANTMQMVLGTDYQKTYIVYNYGEMNWGGGQVGFDIGDGVHFCSISGSRSNTITDVAIRSNIGVAGRWVMSMTERDDDEPADFDNSMCEPHRSNPVCVCDPGYEGVSCGTDIDECDVQPCGEGGTCTQGVDRYSCACSAGYSGTNCEQRDYCHGVTCSNGASCVGGTSGYTCPCGTCQNGGTCNDQTGICSCVTPYSGNTCNVADYCYNNNCGTHSTCVTGSRTYTCQCTSGTGWEGSRCTTCGADWIQNSNCNTYNYCYGVSCGSGTCVNGASSYTCNYCSPNPCQNSAVCSNGANTFTCTCPTNTGWTGTTCATCSADYMGSDCRTRNWCNGHGCQNGGTCVNGASAHTCSCSADYVGDMCATRNWCNGNDCENGATCVNGQSDFSCTCANGWTGSLCSDVDHCYSLLTCHNGGTCNNGDSLSSSTCSCPAQHPNSLSSTCEIEDFCNGDPCLNGAVCTNGQSAMTCTCASGWRGTTCHQQDHCVSSPCLNEGDCANLDSQFTCSCADGFLGETCAVIDHCHGNDCSNGGTCNNHPDEGVYTCTCPSRFPNNLDEHCGIEDFCDGPECLNGGTCNNGAAGYTCSCVQGTDEPNFIGEHCETRNYCDPDNCINGTCNNGALGYTCSCFDWYTSVNCDVFDFCFVHTCANGGTCVNNNSGYTCDCDPDWDIDEFCTVRNWCNEVDCQNGGTCYVGIADFSCACINNTVGPNYMGRNCETQNFCDPNECVNGTCVSETTDYRCDCTVGSTGRNCDVIDHCAGNACLNGATCVNLPDNVTYSCTCPPDYYGHYCEEFDNCYGEDSCQNGATCVDGAGDFTCSCVRGYIDDHCDVLDHCHPVGEPDVICANGAPCVSGERGVNDTGAYSSDNNYYCDCAENLYGLNCTECADGYYNSTERSLCDQYDYCNKTVIECNITTTTECENTATGYSCLCDDEHAGPLCNYDNICTESLCHNNGTCIPVNDTYTCECAKGFNTSNCAEQDSDRWVNDNAIFDHQISDVATPATVATVSAMMGLLALLGILGCVVFVVIRRKMKKKKEEEEQLFDRMATPVDDNMVQPQHSNNDLTLEGIDEHGDTTDW